MKKYSTKRHCEIWYKKQKQNIKSAKAKVLKDQNMFLVVQRILGRLERRLNPSFQAYNVSLEKKNFSECNGKS
ncbi:hypothetical protein BpHYR1_019150 [Brachionus plicatilis]|uniref:Uncharacterized protein n=1 Tax=Brachionus plicatilis TaxID=10195 RepID=A0A3M7PSY5_BRAPC|nr:hypothetical protein BpHYR1_019150 [Brachionus plicatilis]